MLKLRTKVAALTIAALVAALTVTAASAVAKSPHSSGSTLTAGYQYNTTDDSNATSLTSTTAELTVGPTVGPQAGFADIILQGFPSTLPTTEPSFDCAPVSPTTTCTDIMDVYWDIHLANGEYIFGYPSPINPYYTWEAHDSTGAWLYMGSSWQSVLSDTSSAVKSVSIVADDSAGNAPYTVDISGIQYWGLAPTLPS